MTRGWTRQDVTRHELKQALTTAPPSKYRNVKVTVDGERFDSRKEADYWMGLKLRERAGEITELARQVLFSLYAPQIYGSQNPEHAVWIQIAEYKADFVFRDATGRHVVDAKGQKQRICPYPLKKKWLELQEGIVIEEV